MLELDLIDALAAKLEEIFRGMTLPGKDGVQRPIQVFEQYPPLGSGFVSNDDDNAFDDDSSSFLFSQIGKAKNGVNLVGYEASDYDSNFPCVIVRYLEHTDKEEKRFDQSMTSIKLIYGIYDESQNCQGYRDILNMIDLTRLALLQERTLDNQFMMAMPIKTRLLDADTWPVYFGEMDLYYITGRPIMGRDFYTKEAV